jgi:hypothetical protein
MSPPPPPHQTDGLRLDESLQALERRGFRKQFQPLPDAMVECCSCQARHPAKAMQVLARARIEGVSDPADESLVLGMRCPACQAMGTLVLAYGPRARRTEVQVLEGLGHLPPAA